MMRCKCCIILYVVNNVRTVHIIERGNCHGIPYNMVLKSINKLKTAKIDGYEGLTSDYFR